MCSKGHFQISPGTVQYNHLVEPDKKEAYSRLGTWTMSNLWNKQVHNHSVEPKNKNKLKCVRQWAFFGINMSTTTLYNRSTGKSQCGNAN